MTAQLTTLTLVKQRLNIPDSVTTFDDELTLIVDATNEAIECYCNRHFTYQDYAETKFGSDDDIVQLQNHPINCVLYAAAGLQCGIEINYTGTALASVDVPQPTDGTPVNSIKLIANGVATSIPISANDTLLTVAAAINAEADWTATVPDSIDFYPARALIPASYPHFSNTSGVAVTLSLPTSALKLTSYGDQSGDMRSSNRIGYNSQYTIIYKGGYQNYPNDLVNGATQLAADIYNESQLPGGLKSERIGEYSWSRDINLYLDEQIRAKYQVFNKYRNQPGA